MTLPIRNKSRIFIIKYKVGYYIISHFFVIRLGLEPKTYCLEASILLNRKQLNISMLLNSL